jgi:hypothetical protein
MDPGTPEQGADREAVWKRSPADVRPPSNERGLHLISDAVVHQD